MIVTFSPSHAAHAPDHYAIGGALMPARETPQRADVLLAALRAGGHEVVRPRDFGLDPILAVHDAGYVAFLRTAHRRWHEAFPTPPFGDWVYPLAFPNRHMTARPDTVQAQAGYYLGSTTVPIGAGTWQASLDSAHCALEAAEAISAGARLAFALCRPPGHHAYADHGSGFCYLNNAAIAAHRLAAGGTRVAIVDIDVHHGNGTQGIFYERDDVFYGSVHGDPNGGFPYYAGHAHERGEGAGLGCNLNLPLPIGSTDAPWLAAIDAALAAVRAYRPALLVVSLGFDAYHKDASGMLAVRTPAFEGAGARIGALGLPTLLVQEGGYAISDLGDNLEAFLHGLGTTHR